MPHDAHYTHALNGRRPFRGREEGRVSEFFNGRERRYCVRGVGFEARLPRVNGIGGNVPIDELETRDIVEYYSQQAPVATMNRGCINNPRPMEAKGKLAHFSLSPAVTLSRSSVFCRDKFLAMGNGRRCSSSGCKKYLLLVNLIGGASNFVLCIPLTYDDVSDTFAKFDARTQEYTVKEILLHLYLMRSNLPTSCDLI